MRPTLPSPSLRSPDSRHRIRLAAALISLVTLIAAPSAASAATSTRISDFHVHRATTGPLKGAFVVVMRADLSGVLRGKTPSPRTHYRATVRLTANGASVTGTDTTRANPFAHLGRPVYLHVIIPAEKAKLLGDAARVRAKVAIAPLASTKRPMPGTMAARQVRFGVWGMTMCPPMLGCSVRSSPPPSPPVGFTGTAGGATGLMCITFFGPGYQGAEWNPLSITSNANGNYVWGGTTTPGPSSPFANQWGVVGIWVDGFVNLQGASAKFSGTFPEAVLSQPASASMPAATLNYGPAFAGLDVPTSMTLPIMSQSDAASEC